MIDINREKPLTLKEAAEQFPFGAVCYETVRRWATDGVRGIKLEAVRVGGRRKTTLEACERFVQRVTATDSATEVGESRQERSARARERLRTEFGI